LKRVLLDENLPRKLRRDLPEFFVRTVQEEGWTSFTNGELLGRADQKFDVLLTGDCSFSRILPASRSASSSS
jgi:predicted nuclease of predicted toxin-antitoxin system